MVWVASTGDIFLFLDRHVMSRCAITVGPRFAACAYVSKSTHFVKSLLPRTSGQQGTARSSLVGEPDGTSRDIRVYSAAAVVIATEEIDRALPVPGWNFPVFSRWAAQALATGE
jgi:hypothetical protein